MFNSRTTGLALAALALTFLSANAAAQQDPKSVNVGVLNGRAVTMPKPIYPEPAKAAGVSGVVGVNVTIDEAGNVILAEADINDPRERYDADGTKLEPLVADPSLRTAAEEAALRAKFAPTLINGSAVSVKGKIVYNFVADQSSAFAGQQSKIGGGPVLNGKALMLPLPQYPAAAKAVAAQGAVSVQVMVDEQGSVISAAAVSGHPLLRSEAETAARLAKFAPTMLNGQPVKVSGILTYNFVM